MAILKNVKPNRRVRWPYSGREATVVSHGNMGTVVRYREGRKVRFETKSGDVVTGVREFTARAKTFVVASESIVEVLK